MERGSLHEPLGTTTIHPIVVDLENISSRSEDNKKLIADSFVTRVHINPWLRVVPCIGKLLVVATSMGNGESSVGATFNPVPYAPKYKDPPGYDQVADFGQAKEP